MEVLEKIIRCLQAQHEFSVETGELSNISIVICKYFYLIFALQFNFHASDSNLHKDCARIRTMKMTVYIQDIELTLNFVYFLSVRLRVKPVIIT